MKRNVLLVLLLNCFLVYAQTPKELYPSDFIDCERLLFTEKAPDNNELFYCYNEYKNTQRYLRIIGLKDNIIVHNISLQLDVDPDKVEYLKIKKDNIRFVISGIEGFEDYNVDLIMNNYKVLNKKTKDEFWKDFKDVPFKSEFKNSNNTTLLIEPYYMNINNNREHGFFRQEKGQYFFETDVQKYTILFTQLYSTSFLILLQKSNSNIYPYSNDAQQFYKTFLSGYKDIPVLKGIEIKTVGDYVIETDSKNNKIEYKPYSSFDLTQTPWAVSSKSNNKIIYGKIKTTNNTKFPLNRLVIVNGFVNAEKPYLFSQNARAKKVLINTNSFSFEVELEDTGNMQIINLPDNINDGDISLKILSSYEGTKYTDIVISGIYFFVPLE